MKRLMFSVCAYLLFGSIQAHAAVVYAASRCDGCTSAQMTASAKAQGPGNRYVANLKDDVLGYYLVENERIDSGGKTITIATPQVPDPALVSYVGVAAHFYAITNGTMIYRKRIAIPRPGSTLAAKGDSAGVADGRMHVQIPTFVSAVSDNEPSNSSNGDGEPNQNLQTLGAGGITALTAYDMILDGPKRTSVENWLQDMHNWPAGDNALFLLQGAIQAGKIIGGSAITVVIEGDFFDGSHADVAYTSQNQQCKYVPGTAYDSHGNHLPDKLSDLQGREFDFNGPGNPNDHANWSKLVQSWGVTFGGNAGSGGGSHGWACSSTTDPQTQETTWSCHQY